ncbi:MAG: hypothetical protein NTW07_00680 [candidate division Zixibacteria bacterium]|nr:hypothetical protein [candidate division Zixibacteria bacterium]
MNVPRSVEYVSEGLIPAPLARSALGVIRTIAGLMIIVMPIRPLTTIVVIVIIEVTTAIALSLFIN